MGIVSEPRGIADVKPGRLDRATLSDNFGDLHPPLDAHEAKVESDRCYFCYDAPCQQACPTSIDIPLFIREIAAGKVQAGDPIREVEEEIAVDLALIEAAVESEDPTPA